MTFTAIGKMSISFHRSRDIKTDIFKREDCMTTAKKYLDVLKEREPQGSGPDPPFICDMVVIFKRIKTDKQSI